MTIFYDFEVNANEEEREFVFEGESGVVLNEIKEFIKQRIKPLEDEMSLYDEGFVMICIIEDFQIRAYHYPEPLAKKIIHSVSEDDFQYVKLKIEAALDKEQGD